MAVLLSSHGSILMGATLIFPSSVRAAERYAEEARKRGEAVVAASSLAFDETARNFEAWFRLPSVHDTNFKIQLETAIAEYDIERIYCPVLVAWLVLRRMADEGTLSVPVIGEDPVRQHAHALRKLMDEAQAKHEFIQVLSEGRSTLTTIEVAAVLRQCGSILGESDETKLAAVMAIFADAPQGDVVEIGVSAGRSICALTLMARKHGIGPVLAVDPWSQAHAVQHDTAPEVQASVSSWEPGVGFRSFLVALLSVAAPGELNYLALPSADAYARWSHDPIINTPEFGEVRYRREMAVLHIDGNHDYASVREDSDLWLPQLKPGGWLILDDYFWLHGDGPRRVGDDLLVRRAADIARAFTCGKALFVKFRD